MSDKRPVEVELEIMMLKKLLPLAAKENRAAMCDAILECSKEMANKLKPADVDWKTMRENYFRECVDHKPHLKVALAPHDLFEWMKAEVVECLKADKA